MKQRLGYICVLGLALGGLVVTACGDDSSGGADDGAGNGGESGSSAGNKTGGSTSGGSSNTAGSNSGGSAGKGSGGSAGKGSGGSAGKGSGGDAGTATVGGAPDGGTGAVSDGGGDSAGAAGSGAGAGGTGEPALVYACGSDDQFQKACSALVAANCAEPTDCSDCVAQRIADRQSVENDPPCATCMAQQDAGNQCAIDAFESGQLSNGVECFGDVADFSDSCYDFFVAAIECEGYVGSDLEPHDCPATWPPQ